MNPKINVIFGAGGIESIGVIASEEQEELAANEILKKIKPCLDVAGAILKKTNAGPRG